MDLEIHLCLFVADKDVYWRACPTWRCLADRSHRVRCRDFLVQAHPVVDPRRLVPFTSTKMKSDELLSYLQVDQRGGFFLQVLMRLNPTRAVSLGHAIRFTWTTSDAYEIGTLVIEFSIVRNQLLTIFLNYCC